MIDPSNIDPQVGQPVPVSGTSTPVDANADSAAQSQAPTQAPTGTQGAQPNQAPVQAQQPPTQHHIFRDVLATIAGGSQQPVRDTQGNPVTDASGRVQTRQAGVKSLGASILAGALSSMIAGFQHLPERNGNGIVTPHLNEAAQAGAEAGQQNTMNARVQQAQGQADAQRLRQYTTTKQNYDLLGAATTAHRVGNDEVNHMTEQFAPLHDWLANEANNSPEIKAAIHGDELSADELHTLLAKEDGAHVTRDTAIPAGVRPEIGTDGRPTGRLEQTWMALSNDAKINLTPELAQKYGLEGLAPNTQVPLSVLMKSGINNTVNNSVSSIVQNFGKSVDELKGDGSKSNVTLADLKKTNPALRSPANVSALQMIAGMAPDQAVDALRKAGKPDLAATLVGAYGLTDQTLAKGASQRKAQEDAAAEVAKKRADAATPVRLQAVKDAITSNKNFEASDVKTLLSGIPENPTNKELDDVANRIEATSQRIALAQSNRDLRQSNRAAQLDDKLTNRILDLSTKGKDSYSNFAAENAGFRNTLSRAANGDELATAFAKTMGIQGVNKLADLSRISPAEYEAMDTLGSVGRNIVNRLMRAGSGTMAPDTLKELQAMQRDLQQTKYKSYVTNVGLIAKNNPDATLLNPNGDGNIPLSNAQKIASAKSYLYDANRNVVGYRTASGEAVNLSGDPLTPSQTGAR